MDPKNDLKRRIGTVHAKAYYTSRGKGRGGMEAETFVMIAWNDIEAALKGGDSKS